jgi:hypothetical protein
MLASNKMTTMIMVTPGTGAIILGLVNMNSSVYEVENLAEHMEIAQATDAASRLDTVINARELAAPVRAQSYASKIQSGFVAKQRQREREAGRAMKRDAREISVVEETVPESVESVDVDMSVKSVK